MKKLITILSHPLTLSLFITIIIAWLVFPSVPKYELKVKEHIIQNDDAIEYYDDLDGNGYNDRILFHHYPNKITAVTILFKPAKDLKEWHLKGQFVFKRNENFCTGDYDGNGKKEIYVFTVLHDSLFLHCISRLFDHTSVSYTRFIEIVGSGGEDSLIHANMVIGGMADMNRDGYKELIFGVNFGISTLPRNVYSYNIKNDILITSPKNGYFLQNLTLADINGDGTSEIIVNGYASQNYLDTLAYPVHDKHCWLIVLDRNLQYLFPPKGFPSNGYSNLTSFAIEDKSGKNSLFSLYGPPLRSRKPCTLFHFDQKGNVIRKKEISGTLYNDLIQPVIFYKKNVPYLAIRNLNNELYIFDTTFTLLNKTILPLSFTPFITQDIDGDKEMENIVLICPGDTMAVFRQDMRDPALLGIALDGVRINYSLKKEPGQPNQLVIDSGPNLYFILYTPNRLYYTRWFIFAGLFVAFYLFILLIARLQRIRFENRLNSEKKITELQLKIVRNQMDPHFTMNAINSVVDAINREDKEQARDSLLHFSQMYRSLVLSADKIKRTLRDEVDFTENYLALEQFRFGNRFTYKIKIGPGVDLAWEVPKMVIQSPVENAVKHGLLKKEAGGEIIIDARYADRKLILEITDNGIGREASAIAGETSTGKGMEIMKQFFELYHKITGIRVHSTVIDMQDESGKSAGTRVLVTIPLV